MRSTHLYGTINRLIHEEADGSHQVSDDDEVTPALPVHAKQYKSGWEEGKKGVMHIGRYRT